MKTKVSILFYAKKAKAGKMKGTSEEARSINNHLDLLKSQIRDAEMELIYKKIAVSTETMKSKLLGVDERTRMLVPIFQDHNNKIKECWKRIRSWDIRTLHYFTQAYY